MIEELRDYLIRHGIAEDLADGVRDAYYRGGEQGVRDLISHAPRQSRIIALCRGWEIEAGEATIEEIIRRAGSEYFERQLAFLDQTIVGDPSKSKPGGEIRAEEPLDPARLAPGVLDWERDRSLPAAEMRDANGLKWGRILWIDPRTGEGERIVEDSENQPVLDTWLGEIKRERFRAAVPLNIKWRS